MARARLMDLTCENLPSPLGLDVPNPRFRWRSQSSRRGFLQAAYRIRVATSLDVLSSGEPDVWDSGRVESEEGNCVFSGPPLQSFTRYHWSVDGWDDQDQPYASGAAEFVTGVIRGESIPAQWIRIAEPVEYESTHDPFVGERHTEAFAAYHRKEFRCGGDVAAAYALVSAMGMAELWLNGNKVGNRVLDPAPTDYRKDTLYSLYEISDLLDENNCVGAILGNGRCLKGYGFETTGVLVFIHIRYADGSAQTVASDASWTAGHGAIRENGLFYGEHVDAGLAMHGWSTPGSSVTWPDVRIVAGPPPSWQALPPIQVDRDLSAQTVTSPVPGRYVFDFGQNFSGWVRLRVNGPSGTAVTIRHAELLNDDGTLNTATNRFAEATDVYTLSGDGDEVFEPTFTYHGFRYAELSGYPGIPDEGTLTGRFVHSGVEPTGTFMCSNPLINQVHRNIIWGQLSNLMGIPTDCPQRAERQGWLADIQLAVEEAIYNFDMAGFLEKFLDDIRTSQHPEGGISSVVPEYWSIYPADPAWGTAYITIAWSLYWYYGNTRVLETHYDALKAYVDYLHSVADDGVLGYFSKLLFGDWCPPGCVLPKRTPMKLTCSWYYYHDTLLFSKIAGVLGRGDDQAEFESRAETIGVAFNRHFLTDDGYAINEMGPWDRQPGQTSNILPLYLDLVPDERRESVLGGLVSSIAENHDNHLDTGIVGTRYLFDVLTDNGHGETAYRVATQKSYPGWGYMIGEGATTLWERWEKLEGSGMNSQNHIMLGSIDAWFYRAIAGIMAAEPGWRHVEIRPRPLGDLKYATASVRTVLGEVRCSWQKDDGVFTCQVSIPPGAKATVYLPIPTGTYAVTEGEAEIPRDQQTESDGAVTLAIGSGDYYYTVSNTEER